MFSGMIRAAAAAVILTSSWTTAAYAAAEKRVALVIGNSAYEHMGKLANPRNDAELIGSTLQHAGFEVISGIDLGKSEMREKIDEFTESAFEADVAVIYYAGHGMQIDGQNYFIPVDSKIDSVPQVRTQTISIKTFMEALPSKQAVNILILDACRDNPLSRSLQVAISRSNKVERGLANIQASQSNHDDGGLLIAYATDPDDVAADGKGNNSPYSTALARHLTEPGVEIQSALTRVRAEVTKNTSGKQRPWANASLSREVFLGGEPAPVSSNVTPEQILQQPVIASGVSELQNIKQIEQKIWDEASKRNTITLYEYYLKKYPDGDYASIALINLDELKAEQVQDKPGETNAIDNNGDQEQRTAKAIEPAVAVKQMEQPVEELAAIEIQRTTGQTEAQTGSSFASEMQLALDKAHRIELQKRLTNLGFETGSSDGNLGARSRNAIGAWQSANAFPATNYLDKEQYDLIVKQSEPFLKAVRAAPEIEKKRVIRNNKGNKNREKRNVRRKPPTHSAVANGQNLNRRTVKTPIVQNSNRKNTVQGSFGDRGGGGGSTKE